MTRTTSQRLHRTAGLTLLLALLAPAALHAQPAPAPTAPDDGKRERARELFKRGVAAQQSKDWQGAYGLFSQAWTLTRHYQIAGNLGSVEIELRRFRDAAEHLSFALREMKAAGAGDTPQTQALQQLLEQASAQVAQITPRAACLGTVVHDGDIVIDGHAAALAPTVFVEPGMRSVQIRAAGAKSAAQRLQLAAGEQRDVTFQLRLAPTEQTRAAAPSAGPAQPGPAGADGAEGRPMWPWIVGASLAAVGTGLGIGAAVAAGSARSEADDLAGEIGGSAGLDAHVACEQPGAAVADRCDGWQSALDRNGTWLGVAAGSFVAAGAATLGTVLYLAWPEDSQDPQSAQIDLQLDGPSARLRVRF